MTPQIKLSTARCIFGLPVPNGEERWDALLESSWNVACEKGLSRYSLKNVPFRVIPGKYGFLAKLVCERRIRREPLAFQGLQEPFDPDAFHFGRVKEEILLDIVDGDSEDPTEEEHGLLLNVSPFEVTSSLLVPFAHDGRPQVLAPDALRLALLFVLNSSSPDLRIGFNCPLAGATVNHLHFHAYYLRHRLYIEGAESVNLKGPVWTLKDYPVKSFLFYVEGNDDLSPTVE
ncbi:unnamed protein product [Darwinula stevensoni]|uniref:GDPGP1-like N-terminal domain-containing protein n=1 Tax=Darwinula stevensoni TaxID=69355 RepID=A0A7R8X2B8_9CRUS|nr:unnamed protein product [Darwinula stevensoni]CAG0881039.1 unnamed protein product [Darwinula stevensoni]